MNLLDINLLHILHAIPSFSLHLCKECLLDVIKVVLKGTRLIYLMLLYILLPAKLVCVLPGSH